jgi:hypothetical protein
MAAAAAVEEEVKEEEERKEKHEKRNLAKGRAQGEDMQARESKVEVGTLCSC